MTRTTLTMTRSLLNALVATSVLAPLCASCQINPPAIHPDFARLMPSRVAIPPVENKTLREGLDHYPTANHLQRAIFGPAEVNVLEHFREGARESMERKGFAIVAPDLVAAESPIESAGAVTPEAEVRIRLVSWRETNDFDGRGLDAQFEIEIVRVDSGEQLYYRKYPYQVRTRDYGSAQITPATVQRSISAAVRNALYPLPDAPGV